MIKKTLVLIGVVVGYVAMVILLGTPGPKAQITIALPFGTQTALAGASAQIIAPNPTRRSIQICNGTGGVVSVAPQPITPTAANGVQIATSACFTPPPLLTGTSGGAGAGWNGFGTSNVTVLEW
jgi:hypothetical protein